MEKITFNTLKAIADERAEVESYFNNGKYGYCFMVPGGEVRREEYRAPAVHPSREAALAIGNEALAALRKVPLNEVYARVVEPTLRTSTHWLASSRPGLAAASALATVNVWPILDALLRK